MTIKKTFHVHENSFRKLDDPFENGSSKKYVFYAKIDDVPEGIPMSTNPRDQNLKSGVATAISDSLTSNDGYFHLKNRGIVISADSVRYDNRDKTVTINFTDNMLHGNIDGGHTYRIILEHKGENLNQYVQFEVMTGVEDIIESLAESRNTSVQVDEKSLAELAKKFDPIKEALEGMPFYERISFRQNQMSKDENGKNNKMIDAREIVAIANIFNIAEFDATHHPIKAYSSKAGMLDLYLKNPESYRAYVNILPDIFDLYDAIELDFADAYNTNGGRYGRKAYSGYKNGKTVGKSKFGLKPMIYKVPDGLMYPTVGAFRALVAFNNETNKFEWKDGINPVDLWNSCKVELVTKVMSITNQIGDNPNSAGKSDSIWEIAYTTVLVKLLQGVK